MPKAATKTPEPTEVPELPEGSSETPLHDRGHLGGRDNSLSPLVPAPDTRIADLLAKQVALENEAAADRGTLQTLAASAQRWEAAATAASADKALLIETCELMASIIGHLSARVTNMECSIPIRKDGSQTPDGLRFYGNFGRSAYDATAEQIRDAILARIHAATKPQVKEAQPA